MVTTYSTFAQDLVYIQEAYILSLQPHFGHLAQLHSFCVRDSSRSVYNSNQSVVVKLPSFVKVVSPFRELPIRNPVNQHIS